MGLWKNTRNGWEGFAGHIRFAVGEGYRASFWHDTWGSHAALENMFPSRFRIAYDQEAWVLGLLDSSSGTF